jgi:histidinol phosphatase-like enzyme (inositol monophosphatase family)
MPTLTSESTHAIRCAVDHALDQAATVTLPKFRQPIAVVNKTHDGFDPVTEADQQAEQILRDCLMSALPHAGFLGEENSRPSAVDPQVALAIDPAVQAQLTWVVDPIDGTRAFITGLPLWGTLVGLNDGNEVVFGALDQPWTQERFVGWEGHAECVHQGQTRALTTRDYRPLNECIVQTTTPDMFTTPAAQKSFQSVCDAVAMTRYGGDCYAYALLAMGGIDAVVECSLQPYDIQALIPIVQGAGGVITQWSGEPCLDGGTVVASANAKLHEQLLTLLNGGHTTSR